MRPGTLWNRVSAFFEGRDPDINPETHAHWDAQWTCSTIVIQPGQDPPARFCGKPALPGLLKWCEEHSPKPTKKA